MSGQQSNVDKLEEEHDNIIVKTNSVIKTFTYVLTVMAVAYLALFAAVIIVGKGMEDTHSTVDALEMVIGSIEEIRTTNKEVVAGVSGLVSQLNSVPEIPKMKVILDDFTKQELINIKPEIGGMSQVTVDLAALKDTSYMKYPNTDNYFQTYYPKYNAGFYGFGCHVDYCDFTEKTKAPGVSTLDGCLADCGTQWEDDNKDVVGLTYDVGQNACYCSTDKVAEKQANRNKAGFLQFNFPKFKHFARKSA